MLVNATSTYPLENICFRYSIFGAISALKIIFLLPLSTLILYLGHQQWRKQHSFKTASHFDIFTYNMVVVELIWVSGCFLIFCAIFTNHSLMVTVGSVATTFANYGELSFHLVTCVERYLAVVHPITYLNLKYARGVRMRNISILCVWLQCFGLIGVGVVYITPLICFLISSILIISFCSVSVLCVLIHSGPREGGEEKKKIDKSKMRAYHTIIAITCAEWIWFVGVLVSTVVSNSPLLNSMVKCAVELSASWFNLPSCLMLPLLYVRRGSALCWHMALKRLIIKELYT